MLTWLCCVREMKILCLSEMIFIPYRLMYPSFQSVKVLEMRATTIRMMKKTLSHQPLRNLPKSLQISDETVL